jgi:hypothetical protein
MGRSPVCPNVNEGCGSIAVVAMNRQERQGRKNVVLIRARKNVPLRKNPISVLPSPFQSPVTGRSPAWPKVNVRSGAPVVLEFLSSHWPVEGRNTPIVSGEKKPCQLGEESVN